MQPNVVANETEQYKIIKSEKEPKIIMHRQNPTSYIPDGLGQLYYYYYIENKTDDLKTFIL